MAEFALAAAKERGVEDGIAGTVRARRGVEYFAGFGRGGGIAGGLARLLRIDFAGVCPLLQMMIDQMSQPMNNVTMASTASRRNAPKRLPLEASW